MTDGLNREGWHEFSNEAALRYRREAKERLAARLGDDLAEEFFSVAGSTELNVENVAELMAAAYLMGQCKVMCGEGIRGHREML